MAAEDKIARYMRKTLVNQIRQLSCLLKEDKDSIHSQDYLLASIFNTLSLENKSDASMFCLDLCKLKKLAKNCIKVVESHAIIKFDDSIHSIPTNGGDTHWKPNPELWAMRILVIIIKEFLCQSHTLEILTIIYESLVKKIRVLLRHNYSPDEFGPDMKLTALIAHCLSQYDFRQILTPMEVYKLIRDLVFPLAVWCFTREAVNKKKTFQHFEDNFHGLDVFKDINCGKEYEHTYSHVFRLLHVLTMCSESDALGEYRQKFMTMLNIATKSGHINDELIVATNVIVAEKIRIKASISFLEPILLDLLSKSEGLHRAHIAYFILRLMKPLDGVIGDICDNRPRTKTALAMAMFDNLVTREDELLDEIALRSLTHLLSHPYYLGDYLSTLAVENEARILRKLLEISIKPVAYYQLLEHLDRIKEVQSSIEFDKQAQILITYDIDKLDHLINLWNRDEEQKIQLKDHLKRLANLLRLRRQRLEAGLELRLHKLFDRLTNYEFSEYSTPDYGILLVFPNCFQISRSAWHSIIRILQLEAQTRSHVGPMYGRDKQRSEIPNTINTALSHFLMTNSSHFYRETGSPEVIEIIYGHCKRAVDSGSNKNLLKEILHTWPKEVEMTKLNSSEHRSMLEKFIELLVCELEQARKILESSLTTVDIKRFASALSGLVTAVCRHRETLHRVLDSLDHVERLEDRDSWLKHNISTWIWLIIDSTNQVDCPKKAALGASYHIKEESPEFLEGQFKLDDFSDLVIACEVFVMIREDFHECSELSDSFENLLKVIRSALGRSVGRAPIDSLESKRYQQIKSNLPSE